MGGQRAVREGAELGGGELERIGHHFEEVLLEVSTRVFLEPSPST